MGASPTRIDAQQSLLSLGIDSLIALELRNRIKGEFGLNIPFTTILPIPSLSSFAAYIAQRLLQRYGDEPSKSSAQETLVGASAEIAMRYSDGAGPLGIDFVFDATPSTEIYTLSLHDALPI